MVTTNQKPVTDKQKIKRKESKHITIEGHQILREEKQEKKGIEENYKNNHKMSNTMEIRTIITSHVKRLNTPIKRYS